MKRIVKKRIRRFLVIMVILAAFYIGRNARDKEKENEMSMLAARAFILRNELDEALFMLSVSNGEPWYLVDYGTVSSLPEGKGKIVHFKVPYAHLNHPDEWYKAFREKNFGKQVIFVKKSQASRRPKCWPICSGNYGFQFAKVD